MPTTVVLFVRAERWSMVLDDAHPSINVVAKANLVVLTQICNDSGRLNSVLMPGS